MTGALTVTDADLPLQRAYGWARTQPDAVWLTQPIGGGRLDEITWGRAVDEAKRVAAHLQSLGFTPGSRIVILTKNCAHFILADLAIWMAGHVSVPVYATAGAKTLRYVLEHCEAKALFVGKLDSWDEQREGVGAGIPLVSLPLAPPGVQGRSWDEIVRSTAPLTGEPARPADDLATIMYTSGSTGNPKGVMHSFRTMTASALGFIALHGISREDRALSYLPLAHAFERACLETVGILCGARGWFVDSLATFTEDLRRARPTLFISVPALWQKFQQGVLAKIPQKRLAMLLRIPFVGRRVRRKILSQLGLGEVRVAGTGSAPITPELLRWWNALGLELLDGYGMTENFSYSHASVPGKSRAGYVGNACTGVECRIAPDGEIQLTSPSNMLGYYKEPELTRDAFTEDGFLRTGDRGEIDEAGRLRITGRTKDLFKTSKGKYIAPVPIENLLNADDAVEMSCVSGTGRPAPHALVSLTEELHRKFSDAATRVAVERALLALVERVNASLESHERLAFVTVVKERWTIENGFLTPTMKIRRAVIEAAYAPHLDDWYGRGAKVIWQD